jgi:uncharacterized protein
MSDFPNEILNAIDHRPWPMPGGRWIMTQSWHDLLFAHWPVDVRALRERVPSGLDLDLHDGQAWLGVVPFHMTNVAPRGVPSLPFVSAFPELNVRTYVTLHGKPGVYFFSLDAASRIAVAGARALFGLPYYFAEMSVDLGEDETIYRSRREGTSVPSAEFAASYGPVGHPRVAERGTLDYFLTERYCLHMVDDTSYARTVDIHHPPWPLQPAEARIAINTMADAAGIRLPSMAPLLHFAKRQDVVVWPPRAAAVA